MMTKQEIFDTVARHLLTQNERSLSWDERCLYFSGEGGLKCAIGVLIPEEEYNPNIEMETSGIRELLQSTLCPPSLRVFKDVPGATRLLIGLQSVHDGHNPEEWPKRLRELAIDRQLDYSILSEFQKENTPE